MAPRNGASRVSIEPAITSSPDPLADSFNDSFSSLRQGTQQPLPSTFRSSPAKRRSSSGKTLQFEDVIITSPVKAGNRQSSPLRGEDNPSPWRIRVTVQAEPDDEDGEPMTEQMRTRNIRLNDEQDSSLAQRGRKSGRAAKSSPAKGAKRNSTPGRGRGRGRRKSVTDLDITVLGDEDGDDRHTPRKRKTAGRKSKMTETGENDPALEAQSDNKPKRGRPKAKKSVEAFDIAVDEDPQEDRLKGSNRDEAPQESTSSLRELDFNRVALRPRQVNGLKASQSSVSNGESKMRSSTRQASTTSTDYPTPEPSAEDEDSVNEEPNYPDPTDQHDEYDTIMESEGFTMISLDSLSSTKQDSGQQDPNSAHDYSSPIQTALTPQAASAHKSMSSLQPLSAIPSHLHHDHDQSEISSTVPTPPSATALSLAVTPYQFTQNQASPTLPSPPSPPKPSPVARSSTNKSTSLPRLCRVVRAGIALQGVLSPNQESLTKKRQQRLRSPLVPAEKSSSKAKERLDDLFGGFDSGMRRELRAGLRFGEELARRMQGEGSNTLSEQVEEEDDPRVPSINEQASPDDETAKKPKMDFKRSLASSTAALSQQEQAWQLEREAVSRRIQEAKLDQVIIINSDDDHDSDGETQPNGHQGWADGSLRRETGHQEESDYDDDEDIWLSEADRSNENIDPSTTPQQFQQQQIPQRQAENQRQQQAQDQPPRRRSIPSPWKRGEDVDRSSIVSVAAMDETSGLFWLQERPSKLRQDVRRASNVQINRDQRVKQFDLQGVLERSKGSSGLNDASLIDPRAAMDNQPETSGVDGNDDNTNDMTTSAIDVSNSENGADEPSNIMSENEPSNEELEEEHFLSSHVSAITSSRRSARLSNPNLSTSLLSSPPPSSPPLPRKIPVNFNDSSSFLSAAPSSAAKGAAGLPPPLKSSSASNSGPCTPILKKTGSAIELRGRSVEKANANKERRVSFSPLVDTRCFEVVSPEVEGDSFENALEEEEDGSGEMGEEDELEDGDELEEEAEDDDTIEVGIRGGMESARDNGSGNNGGWAPAGRSATTTQTSTPMSDPASTSAHFQHREQTSAPSSSSSSSWLGRLTSLFGTSSSLSPSVSAPTTTPASLPDASKALPFLSVASSATSSTTQRASDADADAEFTKTHHRLLLALYLESINHPCASSSSFSSSSLPSKPNSKTIEEPIKIRPSIQHLVNRAKYSNKKKGGKEWVFDQQGAEVVERWFRCVEGDGGREGLGVGVKGEGGVEGVKEGVKRWSGREREVGKRLFSVRVGWEEREREREREMKDGLR
ncbi:MAG: hypothetical protein Q9160_006502 [Pyrenula sp. 1 TL-2023]